MDNVMYIKKGKKSNYYHLYSEIRDGNARQRTHRGYFRLRKGVHNEEYIEFVDDSSKTLSASLMDIHYKNEINLFRSMLATRSIEGAFLV